nr:hypothetical protein Iba_chr02bCG10530 [Ipomoea batatas]
MVFISLILICSTHAICVLILTLKGILGLSLFILARVPEIVAENSEGLRRLRKSRRQSRSKFSECYTLVQSLFALFFHSVSSSSVL